MSEFPAGRWRQATRAIGRRPLAWLAAVLTAGVALGAVLLLAIGIWSLRPLADAASLAPEASVMLAAGTNAQEADSLRNWLSSLPSVAATRFVSRETALAQLAGRSPADREAIGQLALNPLPDVVVVTFRQGAGPDAIEATAAMIRKMARVDQVELDLAWYRKLRAIGRVGAPVCVAALAGLVLQAGAWLIVAISLSASIDPQRIRLLWLLGADDRFARRASVAAAGLTALAVAAVALVAARAGWVWLDREVASVGQLYANPVRLQWPRPAWLALFAAGIWLAGTLLGSARARLRLRAIRRAPGDYSIG